LPDFVIELHSSPNNLMELKAKMVEYMENGARLGCLIDPMVKKVYVYRPNEKAEFLDNPKSVSGANVLIGFELDLTEIW
jgi:Uma2 family endonuclease